MYTKETKVGDVLTNVGQFPVGSIISAGKKIWLKTGPKSEWKAYDQALHKNLPYIGKYTVEYLPEKPLEVGQEIPAKKLQDLPIGSIFSWYHSDRTSRVIVTSEGPKGTSRFSGGFVSLNKFVTYLTYTLEYLPETSK